jgi:hypothetical protein
MTAIPGTKDINTKDTTEKINSPVVTQTKIIGVYKKEPKQVIKYAVGKEKLQSQLIIQLKISGFLSMISIILGFLVYKSFFILAIFIPFAHIGIWYLIKIIEGAVSKFDPLSK